MHFGGVAQALARRGRISLENETGRVRLYRLRRIVISRKRMKTKENRTDAGFLLTGMLLGRYLACGVRVDTQEKVAGKERNKRKKGRQSVAFSGKKR